MILFNNFISPADSSKILYLTCLLYTSDAADE